MDCWAVGCVIAEMVRKRPLFKVLSVKELLLRISEVCGSPSEEALGYLAYLPGWRPLRFARPGGQPKVAEAMWGNASVQQTRIVEGLLNLHPRHRSTAQESLLLLQDGDLSRSGDGGVHRPSSSSEEPEEERASAAVPMTARLLLSRSQGALTPA